MTKKRASEKPAGELIGHAEGNDPRQKYNIEPTYDSDGVQRDAGILTDGREEGDPTPVEVPLHMRQPSPLDQLIRNYVRGELSQIAQEQQFETFEESDDFEIEEDPIDELTPYEKVFEPVENRAPEDATRRPPAPAEPAPASSSEVPAKSEVPRAPSQAAKPDSTST